VLQDSPAIRLDSISVSISERINNPVWASK
jgi:hypothetical protein